MQVSDLSSISESYRKFTFESCLCARFRYIGKHHYYDLNRQIAEGMYKTIMNFGTDKNEKAHPRGAVAKKIKRYAKTMGTREDRKKRLYKKRERVCTRL